MFFLFHVHPLLHGVLGIVYHYCNEILLDDCSGFFLLLSEITTSSSGLVFDM